MYKPSTGTDQKINRERIELKKTSECYSVINQINQNNL